ncbi:MAG: TolC family protein [Ekhidna sp.]
MKTKIIFFLLSSIVVSSAICQDVLSKEEAVKLALESNFDIVQANQSVLIEENNTSIYNTGYLPTLNGNANINYNLDNIEAVSQSDSLRVLDGAKSDSRSAGLSLNWVLFDGFNRKYSISRNQVNYSISQLNAKATLEVVLLDLFSAYYEVARTQKTVSSLKQTLKISKDRLRRTEYSFEYGQSTKLDISNAQVDVNTDSINVLNTQQTLDNAHRNLNFILARDANTSFSVDTIVIFSALDSKEQYLSKIFENNTQILLSKEGLTMSDYNTKINSSRYLPTLSVNGDYNYRFGNNNRAAFLASNTSSGISYGATLSWNIFDGGGTKTSVQNARIDQVIQENVVKQATQQAILNFENAWSDYQNRLFIVTAQEKNVELNQENFERTNEKYKLGQVTSLDFRTAQNNLLQSEIDLTEAKFNAKIAELTIYQLTGEIQDANF